MRINNGCRIFILSAIIWCLSGCTSKDYRTLIEQGEFRQATWIIQEQLKNDKALDPEQRLQLQFELERIERIRQDFQRTEKEVLDYIKKYLPDVGAKDLTGWEKSGALEMLIIDGKKWYFNNAAPNLFRLDPQLKAIKHKADSLAGRPVGKEFDLDGHCRQIINTASRCSRMPYRREKSSVAGFPTRGKSRSVKLTSNSYGLSRNGISLLTTTKPCNEQFILRKSPKRIQLPVSVSNIPIGLTAYMLR